MADFKNTEVKLNQEKEVSKTEKQDADNADTAVKYRDSGIDERIIRAVEELGFENMTPIQQEAIPLFSSGKDVIGQAQTGTGKTAAFGIPILEKINPDNRGLQAIILCPTRELAMQAADELRKFSKYMSGIKVLAVYGGQDINKQIRGLKGGVQIVVGTPGRVMDHMRRHTLKLDKVHTVVLDEADEMLNMGFREDIETILKEVPEERQTGLFSATMPKPILDITKMYQKDAVFLKMTPKEITIPLIKQAYYQVPYKEKTEVISRLLDYYDPGRSLIFCNTKRMVDELTENLKGRGYAAEGLHGDLSQNQRDTVMNLFKNGHAAILIATDVAARGIDIDNVEAVFNYDIPEDIEYYVHRIGRTGRAGKTGRSFTLVTNRELYKLRDIERVCHTRIKERKIPSAADIMARKGEKILREAEEVIESQDLSRAIRLLEAKSSLGEYSILQYAAAFMKMKMGEDIEDIKQEKFFPDFMYGKKRRRGGDRGRGDRDRGERNRNDKERGDRKRSDRDRGDRSWNDRGRGDRNRDSRNRSDKDRSYSDNWNEKPYRSRTGRSSDRKEANNNNRYAALRIRTKKKSK
ncbi:MAG: DEAD/DEAH box helicase [Clostridiales bacterium]|nr:DEAD/DEAH box helicase [Clostridiales bacterium]